METPIDPISLRDRAGALLRSNRPAILAEVLLLFLLMLLRLQSQTILLLLFCGLSLWLRRSGWRYIGLNRPADWPRTVLAGIGIGALYQLFSTEVLVPILYRFTGTALNLSQFASLKGNLASLAVWLTVSWTLGAFGEEMVYRGYVPNRLTDLLGHNRLSLVIGILISAAFFGIGHWYQGITGILETFVFGLVMSCLYVATKYNLWLPIIAHGMYDTGGFVLIFLGLYP